MRVGLVICHCTASRRHAARGYSIIGSQWHFRSLPTGQTRLGMIASCGHVRTVGGGTRRAQAVLG
jgi:hypothetical protein